MRSGSCARVRVVSVADITMPVGKVPANGAGSFAGRATESRRAASHVRLRFLERVGALEAEEFIGQRRFECWRVGGRRN